MISSEENPMATSPDLQFITQRPRDDGCGVVVLSMLTGKPYDAVAALIDWKGQPHHHTTWKELRGVLSELGWQLGDINAAAGWDDIHGLAIVHVMDDHFMLYDEGSGLFYDPWEYKGPQHESHRMPLSFVTVTPPSG
jgi:hypothetical protein